MTDKRVYATIALLAETWPAAFSIPVADRRPLKVGVATDIATAAAGAITPAELEAALRAYVGHKRYLRTLKAGAQRVDLDGNPAGEVTAEQAAIARQRIEEMDARASARTRATGLWMENRRREREAKAEKAQRAAEDARHAAEGRKPLLRLPQSVAAVAAA